MIQSPVSRWFKVLAFGLLTLAIQAPTAQAAPSGPAMALGARVAPPRGYIDFCSREPGECPASLRSRTTGPTAPMADYWRLVFEAVEPAALPHDGGAADALRQEEAARPLSMTPALWRELNSLNQSINAEIAPSSDADVYGRSDYWALPLEGRRIRAGDCEDYVLEKRHALRERGYADNLLSIALVTTGWGESHAVLLVQTDQGDLVLDSLSPRITAWRDTSYRLVSRQSPQDPAVWVAAADRRARR